MGAVSDCTGARPGALPPFPQSARIPLTAVRGARGSSAAIVDANGERQEIEGTAHFGALEHIVVEFDAKPQG